ncbi:MAG: hypothetical protein LBL55_05135, partial [Propionibacteriaceae bacterium]|nr:hypothetical protein [Propionibacteriaceae bacterium]
MTTIAPHGCWASPVSLELVSRGGVGLPEGWADGRDYYWLRSDPGQGGRTSLFRRRAGQTVELTPHHNLRSRIHDYGGRPAGTKDGVVVYTDQDSGAVLVLEPDRPGGLAGDQTGRAEQTGGTADQTRRTSPVSRTAAPAGPGPAAPPGPADPDAPTLAPRVIVSLPGLDFAGFAVLPRRRQAVALRQDRRDPADVRDALVVLELDAPNLDGGRVLAQGADFYQAPQVSPEGDVVWMEWDHPNMPWDATAIKARHLDGGPTRPIAGDGRSAVVHPAWAPDGSILFLDDQSGHWNFRRWRDGAVSVLHRHPFDCCDPAWVLQPPPYAPLADGSIGCAWREDGWAKLGRLIPDGRLVELDLWPERTAAPDALPQATPADPAAADARPETTPERPAAADTRPQTTPANPAAPDTRPQTRPANPAVAGGRPQDVPGGPGHLAASGLGQMASAQVTPGDPTAVVRLGWTDRPGGLYTLDWATGRLAPLAVSANWSPPPGLVPATRGLSWQSERGPVQAWHYPPTNP